MAPPPENPSFSPYPVSWVQPREPCVLRPLKPLVLSPGDVDVCEWITLPHPSLSLPEAQSSGGRTRKPLMEAEKRESVLYTVLI